MTLQLGNTGLTFLITMHKHFTFPNFKSSLKNVWDTEGYALYMMHPATAFAVSNIHVVVIPILLKKRKVRKACKEDWMKNALLFPYSSEFMCRGRLGVGCQASWQTWIHPLDNCLEAHLAGLGSWMMMCLRCTAGSAFVFLASCLQEIEQLSPENRFCRISAISVQTYSRLQK